MKREQELRDAKRPSVIKYWLKQHKSKKVLMPQIIFDDSEEQVFEEKLKPEEGVDYNYSTGYESM